MGLLLDAVAWLLPLMQLPDQVWAVSLLCGPDLEEISTQNNACTMLWSPAQHSHCTENSDHRRGSHSMCQCDINPPNSYVASGQNCRRYTLRALDCLEGLSDLTKVVSPSLQLPHSSLVRVTSRTYLAAAASDVAGLLCLQRTATLRHPCTAELRWPQHPWAQFEK